MESKIIYEVLRVIDGKPLFLENHLKRMERSFSLINMDFPLSEELLCLKIEETIKVENKNEGNIKITYDVNLKELKIFFIPHNYPTLDQYERGVKTIFYFGERENPNAKIVNNDFRAKVTEEIKLHNAYEAILVDRNGFITEGSKSNIFMVKNDELLTSPTKAVLPGVTRGEIIEIANKLNIVVKEIEYSYKEIKDIDGMFICGTSPKVLPINCVDKEKMNVNNQVIKKIMQEYNKEIVNYIKKIKK